MKVPKKQEENPAGEEDLKPDLNEDGSEAPPKENEEPEPGPVQKSDREIELEKQLERERGKNEALSQLGQKPTEEKKPEPALDPEEQRWNDTKSRVMSDVGQMDDERFQEVYKMSKAEARIQVQEQDSYRAQVKSNERTARIEAESRLAMKYGQDFGEVAGDVRKFVAELSPEVRQDPDRLERALEREFKLIRSEKPKPKEEPKPAHRS